MFTKWGDFVQRHRKLVALVMMLIVLALGIVGRHLPEYLSQSGWFDPGSDSIKAAELEEDTFGRDNSADVVVLYDAPAGKTVDNKAFAKKVQGHLDKLAADNPEYIDGVASYWNTKQAMLATKDKKHAMASIRLKGWGNDILKNYRKVEDKIPVPGVSQHVAGQTPVSGALDTGMAKDIKRAELAGLPIVGVLLIFVFGGVIAALLPLLVGGLSIIGSTGILTLIAMGTEVNAFAQSCVTLIGLGLAIDYALFIVSRFREELAKGFNTHDAVTRSVATAGRTVIFSAVMVAVALSAMMLFPQAFLKSVAYGTISAVFQAALLSLTLLPIILSYLGKRIDWLSFNRHKKEPTPKELYNSFWGRISGAAMKHPVATMVPIVVVLLLLAVPMGNLKFGGINETYLPPNHETRVAQETFDRTFPTMRTNPVKIVVKDSNGAQTGAIIAEANQVEGLTGPFRIVKQTDVDKEGRAITVLQSGVVDMNDNSRVVQDVRDKLNVLYAGGGTSDLAGISMQGSDVYVGGNPALEKDSITALLRNLPAMAVYMLLTMTILMFLTFGSLVIPIKAIIMTLLSIATTLGVLTLIFIDGVGANLLNFTPGPMMSATLVLIIAILFGLSTDYEVFLVSRMVEAHAAGHSTEESIRFGTASTGRIITAAAAIMIVVTGAFGFSEIVMMKYIAFGMVIALFLDATVVRMLLVPSVMKLLGDDNWWAPLSLKKLQRRIGLSESELVDDGADGMMDFGATAERKASRQPALAGAAVGTGAAGAAGAAADYRRAKRLQVNPQEAQPVRHARRIDMSQVGDGNSELPRAVRESLQRHSNASATPADRVIENPYEEQKSTKKKGFFGRRRAERKAAKRAQVEKIREEQRAAQQRAQLEAQAAAQAAALEAANQDPYQDQFGADDSFRDQSAGYPQARYEDDYAELFDHTETQRSSYQQPDYPQLRERSSSGLRSVRVRPTPDSAPTGRESFQPPKDSWVDSGNEDKPISTAELMRRLREENDN